MLVGISGFARAGKDSAADALVDVKGYVKLSFADPMREALLKLDPLIHIGEGNVAHLSQALSHMTWDDLKSVSPDIRPLLQRLGTEVGREMFGENFWVELALKEAKKYEDVVFADVRFVNEADAIKEHGGIVIRIERPDFGPANDHVSENEMTDYEFDWVIKNDEDLSSLATMVNHAVSMLDDRLF